MPWSWNSEGRRQRDGPGARPRALPAHRGGRRRHPRGGGGAGRRRKAGNWTTNSSAARRSSTPSPAAIRRSSARAGRRRRKSCISTPIFTASWRATKATGPSCPACSWGRGWGAPWRSDWSASAASEPEANSRPPFWGLAVDYALLEKGRLGLRLRTVAGFMYKNKEDELAKLLSLVVEPGFGLSWALSHRHQPHHPGQPRFRQWHQRRPAPLLLGAGAGTVPAVSGRGYAFLPST